MRVILSLFLVSVIFFLTGCLKRDRKGNTHKVIHLSDLGIYSDSRKDQTQKFQAVLAGLKNVSINFSDRGQYVFSDIRIINKQNIRLIGNSATIFPPANKPVENIFKFINSENIAIENLIIDGKFPNSKMKSYAIEIDYLNPETKGKTTMTHVKIQNTDFGGVNIQNINPDRKNIGFGAEEILIDNCSFDNFGTFSALRIRGAHRNVTVKNCQASDLFGRQERGKIYAFTAHNRRPEDAMQNLLVKDCMAEYTSKATVFLQQVKNARIENIQAKYVGKNKKGTGVGANFIKIDNLGFGNKAVIKNCSTTQSKQLKSYAFIYLVSDKKRETKGVEIIDCHADLKTILGGQGHHKVIGGSQKDFPIIITSPGNLIDGVKFKNLKTRKGLIISNSENIVRNCTFEKTTIQLRGDAKEIDVENCNFQEIEKHCISFSSSMTGKTENRIRLKNVSGDPNGVLIKPPKSNLKNKDE